MTGKQKVQEVLDSQPDDATFEELIRELAFHRMVERGRADIAAGRTLSHEEVGRRIGYFAL